MADEKEMKRIGNYSMGIKDYFCRIIMLLFRIFPLQQKVVFSSFCGKQYSDNPRAIFEKMKMQYPDWEYVWILNDSNIIVDGSIVVRDFSIAALFHLATAKIWVDNSRKWNWVVKRKKQYYVQTWHGDVCVKKIEKDAVEALDKKYIQLAKHDSQMIDLVISGSKFRTENYQNSFWYSGEILEKGTPKSDVFYQDPEPISRKVKKFFQIPENTRIVLYAPTFRVDSNISCYNINYDLLLDYIKNSWGGDWVVIIRLHPKIQEKSDGLKYTDRILNGTKYDSFDDLLISSDLLITDYSGTMFQAVEANKRVIIYATDLADYMNDRGTYFNIKELPFPLSQNQDELHREISSFDECLYQKELIKLKDKLGFFNSGNSSSIVAKEIIERGKKK